MAPLSDSLRIREQPPTYLDNLKSEHTQIGYNIVSLLCLIVVAYMASKSSTSQIVSPIMVH